MKIIQQRSALFIIIGALLLSACSSQSSRPDWIDTPAKDYPADSYISAVGEADDREAAATRARANISKTFQVAINDSSVDFSQSIMSSSNGQQQIDNQQRAARFVSSEAQQVLEGTEIIEYWRTEGGKVYSLAVLEKATASRRFRDTIRDADRKTEDLVNYASNQANNPVVALRALDNARLSQVDRDNANRNLMVTSGKGITGKYSGEQITGLIRNSLSVLEFTIKADDPAIQSELENAVASLGIKQTDASNLVLASKLDTEPLTQVDGWWWLRGSIELTLTDNNEAIAKQRWEIKESSTDKGVTQQRVRDAVNDKLGSYLYEMLTQKSL